RLGLTFNPSHAVPAAGGSLCALLGTLRVSPCLSSARRKTMSNVMHPVSDVAVATPAQSSCAPPPAFSEQWLNDLRAANGADVNWLWQGYLAPGNITLLTSQWKAGKTTLVSVLLSRLKDGGTVGGLPLRAGKAAVVTEEDAGIWLQRS